MMGITLGVATVVGIALALPSLAEPVLVSSDNFTRAESDLYFSGVVANGGFGTFDHTREMAPMDKQTVIRLNRDTLYSSAVFDLDAAPVTITVPKGDGRFISMQVIDQDQYTYGVFYEPGEYTLTREGVGTRYVLVAFRTFADPNDPDDLEKAHAIQDQIATSQAAKGEFVIPEWDKASQDKTRSALLQLSSLLPDTFRMFGKRADVDPVRFLIGAAQGWGANPPEEALYLNRVPAKNDGTSIYKMTVGDVPVGGFWSISIYNAEGYFVPNEFNAYSLNNVTAKKSEDGKVHVQFGGCDGEVPNCLPTPDGWNYMVRLYRPKSEILDGTWQFPEAELVQ